MACTDDRIVNSEMLYQENVPLPVISSIARRILVLLDTVISLFCNTVKKIMRANEMCDDIQSVAVFCFSSLSPFTSSVMISSTLVSSEGRPGKRIFRAKSVSDEDKLQDFERLVHVVLRTVFFFFLSKKSFVTGYITP